MGSSLEFAKLVTASWLYRNWHTSPKIVRGYLTFSVVVLMLITSMGIFGFLAKSHIDSTLDAGANSVELKTLNAQEKMAREKLDYLLARAKDPSTASNKLDNQIQQTQKELTDINKKRLPLLKQENKLTADVGPIKYVADMFFNGDDALNKAVRMVIFIIMLVFDPLAVLLLIAGNISLGDKNGKQEKFPKSTEKKDEYVVEVQKENLATMEEPSKPLSIEVEGNILRTHTSPGVYSEHHTYDENSEFAFKQKTDAGKF
jgi:hypothetical protein